MKTTTASVSPTQPALILRKDGRVMDVERVIRQAELLTSVKYLAAHRCVQEHDRRFLWKAFACWESHGELFDGDEHLVRELRSHYPANWGTTLPQKVERDE